MLGYKRQVFSEDQIVSSAAGKESIMFRLWGKEFKDNRMLCDTVICDETDDTRTHKIFHALDTKDRLKIASKIRFKFF